MYVLTITGCVGRDGVVLPITGDVKDEKVEYFLFALSFGNGSSQWRIYTYSLSGMALIGMAKIGDGELIYRKVGDGFLPPSVDGGIMISTGKTSIRQGV